MSGWKLAAVLVGAYALGSAAAVVYLVSRGGAGKGTFDGFTGNESEGAKAAEAILLWPAALAITLKRSASA